MSRSTAPHPKIQLLVFPNCPLAAAARASLKQALDELSIAAHEEIDILDPATPDELRGWGSPTILVDGEDVSGAPKGDSVGCRVYQEPGRVPSPATIVAGIRRKRDTPRPD
jgi:hypothetical protein